MKTLDYWIRIARASMAERMFDDDAIEEFGLEEDEYLAHPWEMEMMVSWSSGARLFGKVAATVAQVEADGTTLSPTQIKGEVRSLLCPEPPPEGCEFYLAWHDGVTWRNWVPVVSVSTSVLPVIDDPSKPNGTKPDFKFGMRAARDERERSKTAALNNLLTQARDKDRMVAGFFDQLDSMEIDSALKNLVERAFQLGSKHGHSEALEQMRPVLERDASRNRGDEMVEMVEQARRRHPEAVTADQLLTKMQGVPTETTDWRFPDGRMIDKNEFQRAFRLSKKRESRK